MTQQAAALAHAPPSATAALPAGDPLALRWIPLLALVYDGRAPSHRIAVRRGREQFAASDRFRVSLSLAR